MVDCYPQEKINCERLAESTRDWFVIAIADSMMVWYPPRNEWHIERYNIIASYLLPVKYS